MKQNSHTELGLHAVIKYTSHNAGVMESPAQSKVIISCHGSEGLCSPLCISQLSAYNQEENKEILPLWKSLQKEKKKCTMYMTPSFLPSPPSKKKGGGERDQNRHYCCSSHFWERFFRTNKLSPAVSPISEGLRCGNDFISDQ